MTYTKLNELANFRKSAQSIPEERHDIRGGLNLPILDGLK